MHYEPSVEKAFQGYLKMKTKFDFIDYNLYETIYLLMEHSVPSSRYGTEIESKIIEVFGLEDPKTNDYDASIYKGKGKTEIKVSIMDIEKKKFNITNIRPFMEFDFYLITLIDPSDEFVPYFYLIPKELLENEPLFKMNPMNSGGEASRFSFCNGDKVHKKLEELNLLTKFHFPGYYIEKTNYNALAAFIDYYKGKHRLIDITKTTDDKLNYVFSIPYFK